MQYAADAAFFVFWAFSCRIFASRTRIIASCSQESFQALVMNFLRSLYSRGTGFIVAVMLAACTLLTPACAEAFSYISKDTPSATVTTTQLPPEARETLALIRSGGPFPYEKDGTTFGNYEQALPRQKRGYYTEYTVKTPGAKNRGARRIIAGKGRTGSPATSGEYWYTADHYKTFRRIVETKQND